MDASVIFMSDRRQDTDEKHDWAEIQDRIKSLERERDELRNERKQAIKNDFANEIGLRDIETKNVMKQAFKEWLTEQLDGAVKYFGLWILKALAYIFLGSIVVFVLWSMGWKPASLPGNH